MQTGFVHVITGDGKGKTTSSVGLSVRAKSRGLRVLFAQFMKGSPGGETELLEKLSIDVIRFKKVLSPYFYPDADRDAVRQEVLSAFKQLEGTLGDYELVVLDEFNCLLLENIISEDEALAFLRKKPKHVELVLTGRGATQTLMDFADYVMDIKHVKRPESTEEEARKGIEY